MRWALIALVFVAVLMVGCGDRPVMVETERLYVVDVPAGLWEACPDLPRKPDKGAEWLESQVAEYLITNRTVAEQCRTALIGVREYLDRAHDGLE